MKKTSLISVLTLFILGACISQENLTFDDWDKNDNTFISRSEFMNVFKKHHADDWNIIEDEYLDDKGFFQGSFKVWDVDKDTLLSKDEWKAGHKYYFGDYVVDDYVTIDTDNDGFIEYDEYYNVLVDTNYYSVWDVDKNAYLSENELARAIFNNWDLDDSNFIELEEYKMLDAYYLDI